MISVFGCDITEIEVEHVSDTLRSQWLGLGSKVKLFEDAFEAKFDTPIVMLDNCSNALYMAVKMLELPAGSKIALPSVAWVSCAHAIVLNGHTPVFCDVDYKTMNIKAEYIPNNVDAIMVIHYAGLAVEMDDILAMNKPVIEDAAHAVCSTYHGKHCGTIGNVGVYSFNPVKNIATSDGGAITCNDLSKAKVLRYCGIGKSGFEAATASSVRWWEHSIQDVFIRSVPNNVSASIGLAQLERLDELQARRRAIWNIYQQEFGCLGWVERPVDAIGDMHSYFTYCIKVSERDKLAGYLYDNGIYTTFRFHPLHYNENLYGETHRKLDNTEKINARGLNLPIHPHLADSEVDKIVSVVKKFGENRKELHVA